ncbi:hypothetical protein AS026_21315 [Rhizobium altiplani]|uniref:Uncharacterized protein n=1 Tax=Rhizobium altiplani TaxID=1864509 RepID=A0A109J4E4_9HYPH|nr:hypothetical protein AS026_21315 [Rhizobium altiplani]
MIDYQVTSDATAIYRDTTGARLATTNSAGDVGNVAAIMRDSTVRVNSPFKAAQVTLIERSKIVG